MNEDSKLLTQFESHLLKQDPSPATIRAYLSDLSVFQKWLIWLHDGYPYSNTITQLICSSFLFKRLQFYENSYLTKK